LVVGVEQIDCNFSDICRPITSPEWLASRTTFLQLQRAPHRWLGELWPLIKFDIFSESPDRLVYSTRVRGKIPREFLGGVRLTSYFEWDR
jgi:hypothetical protein